MLRGRAVVQLEVRAGVRQRPVRTVTQERARPYPLVGPCCQGMVMDRSEQGHVTGHQVAPDAPARSHPESAAADEAASEEAGPALLTSRRGAAEMGFRRGKRARALR